MTKPGEGAANPIDEMEVQLPGRLLTVEILLTLLLREKASSGRLMAQARQILQHVENEIIQSTPADKLAYPFAMFATARAALDKVARDVG